MLLINRREVGNKKFPNGETQFITHFSLFDSQNVEFQLIYENNDDLFNLLVYKKYADEYRSVRNRNIRLNLKAKFLPYGQSDREFVLNEKASEATILAFKYFAQLLNEANFDKVTIYDPHSLVMINCLKNCEVRYPCCDFVGRNHNNYDLLFFPDNGAAKKYSEILENILPYTFAYKKRDLSTGKILSLEVVDSSAVKNARILIVDDLIICGGTYKYAAQKLKELGAKSIDLYITHLMPSSKDFWLSDYKNYGIDAVYSADTLNMYEKWNLNN